MSSTMNRFGFYHICLMSIKSRHILFILLSVLVGAVFIFSAYAKTLPIDDFTNTIFNRIEVSWKMASWAARFFIGLEASIGALLLLHIYGRSKWILWMSLFLLVIFSGYLVGLWFTDGNNVDCGCMGNVIPMTPFWSLVKNAVLMGIISLLIKMDRNQNKQPLHLASIITCIIFTGLPFILYPNKLPLHIMYENSSKSTTIQDDLRIGKHLVAFMSLTCPHCKAAAAQMEVLKKQNPDLPIHLIFMDHARRDSLLQEFVIQTKIEQVPHDFLEAEKFTRLAGEYVPAIYLMTGENIDDRIEPPQLTPEFLNQWLKD